MYYLFRTFFLLILLLSGSGCLRHESKHINENNIVNYKSSDVIEGKFIDLPRPIYNDSFNYYYDVSNIKLDSEEIIDLRHLKIKNILVFGKFLAYINNNSGVYLFNKDNINKNEDGYNEDSYLWKINLDLKNQSLEEAEFAYNNKDIFILVNRRYIYSLSIDDGRINWRYDYKILSESHLLLNDDSIYLSNVDGTLTSLNAQKGTLNWVYNDFSAISNDNIMRKDERINLAVKYNILIYTPYSGNVHAIDPSKGNLLWSIDLMDHVKVRNKDEPLKDIFDIKPYIFDINGVKKVIIGSSKGYFVCFTLKGELEWINDFDSQAKPFFINNYMFVSSNDEMKIFDIKKSVDSHNLWKIKLQDLQDDGGIKEVFIVNNKILLITKSNSFLKFAPYIKGNELVVNYENHGDFHGYQIAMGNVYIY